MDGAAASRRRDEISILKCGGAAAGWLAGVDLRCGGARHPGREVKGERGIWVVFIDPGIRVIPYPNVSWLYPRSIRFNFFFLENKKSSDTYPTRILEYPEVSPYPDVSNPRYVGFLPYPCNLVRPGAVHAGPLPGAVLALLPGPPGADPPVVRRPRGRTHPRRPVQHPVRGLPVL